MELPSYQEHSQDREIIDTILVNRSWVSPNENCIRAAEYLSQLGFIKLGKYYFVICANDLDLDFPNVQNPYCKNEIIIPHDFNESFDDLACEDCGRNIFPDTYKKQRYLVLSIKLNTERIVNWFEDLLIGLMWEKATEGIYYISFKSKIVSVIIPALCTDKSCLTIDRLRTNAAVLITLGKTDLKLLLNLCTVPMADLICEYRTLNEILSEAVEKGVPELLPNVSFQALNYVPLQKTTYQEKKILRLKIIDNTVYVNDVEIISKQATSSIRIFRVLFKQFLRDLEAAEEYKFLSVIQIADSLNIEDPEQQVRRPLNRMQKQ
ncbi:hypothetical protein GOM44_00155 [Wolbachia endosymbiont of Atemnus politus]|uniref:hypothetical protein n=1 Tax=Wolbachia endosymbiont of Atemnus politus TaxID=2682840 RepID=UPI001571AAD3|nr:hypothetical protein [Wolbachia endosymbiont of Atemnus politus]NSX82967.1 hypothetical protein [Wolbachia endosymbiont of Atemnus politus]